MRFVLTDCSGSAIRTTDIEWSGNGNRHIMRRKTLAVSVVLLVHYSGTTEEVREVLPEQLPAYDFTR